MVPAVSPRHTRRMSPNDAASPMGKRLLALSLRLSVPLVGICVLTLGLFGLLSYGVLPAVESMSMQGWHAVPVRLERVVVRPGMPGLLPPFDTVEVAYRYEAGGVERTGRRLDVHDGRAVRSQAAAIAAALQMQGALSAWVHPDDPLQVVMRREPRWDVLVFVLPALAMLVAGGVMLFVGMVAWNGRGMLAPRPVPRT